MLCLVQKPVLRVNRSPKQRSLKWILVNQRKSCPRGHEPIEGRRVMLCLIRWKRCQTPIYQKTFLPHKRPHHKTTLMMIKVLETILTNLLKSRMIWETTILETLTTGSKSPAQTLLMPHQKVAPSSNLTHPRIL